jgi:sulfofructose kinase
MSHIAFVGHAVWDHIFKVPRLHAEPGKWVAQSYACRPGGMCANAALAAQAVRAPSSPRVKLAAPMGDDEAGRSLAAALLSAGVEVQPACVIAGARTSVSAVLVDDCGERQGHNVRGNAQEQSPLPDSSWLVGARGLQVDPRWPRGAQRALELARASSVISLLDGDVAPAEDLRSLAPLADWVVFSSDGLRAWSGDAQAPIEMLFHSASEALPETQLAVTLGAKGLLWRHRGRPSAYWPSFTVPVVNTNGAGDALHGVLLMALAEGVPAETALRMGMAAGALTCTGQAFQRAAVTALAGVA